MIDELRDSLHTAQTCGNPERALDYAIGVHQHAASLITALQAVQAEAKDLIGEVFLELATTDAATPSGRAYVTKPSTRITYDAKGLDALAGLDEELATVLDPYRRVTEVAGTLTIRPPRS